MNTEVGGGSRSLKSMTGLVTASLVFLVLAVAACAAAWLLDLEILFAVGGGLALATAVPMFIMFRRVRMANIEATFSVYGAMWIFDRSRSPPVSCTSLCPISFS